MKKKIPLALREQVWILYCGDKLFKHKCLVNWCENIMTPFNFEAGHNVPESKEGPTDLDNLRPICSKCNKSMGDTYTIDEFSELSKRSSLAQPEPEPEPEPEPVKKSSKEYMKKFRKDPENVFRENKFKILSSISKTSDYKASLKTLEKYNITIEEVTTIRTEKNYKPFNIYSNDRKFLWECFRM